MTFRTKPQIQGLLPALQQRLQQNFQSGPVQEFSPVMVATLPFDIASQVVKWSTFRHTVAALNSIQIDYPSVPVDETHFFESVAVKESGSAGGWSAEVLYPITDVLTIEPLSVEMNQPGNRNSQNILLTDNGNNAFSRQGLPLIIYPGGVLRLASNGGVAAAVDIDVFLLWRVGPAPLQVGPQVLVPTVTEI